MLLDVIVEIEKLDTERKDFKTEKTLSEKIDYHLP